MVLIYVTVVCEIVTTCSEKHVHLKTFPHTLKGGGGGKGRFGYVWLILGKDFKISQKIVSQSLPNIGQNLD